MPTTRRTPVHHPQKCLQELKWQLPAHSDPIAHFGNIQGVAHTACTGQLASENVHIRVWIICHQKLLELLQIIDAKALVTIMDLCSQFFDSPWQCMYIKQK